MRILDAEATRQALPMPALIAAMKRAFAALSAGEVVMPQRAHMRLPAAGGTLFSMPAWVHTSQGDALAVKVVSVYPGNPQAGLPLVQAAVLTLDAATGRPLALLEGNVLTARRTGAASGAATDLLARPDSRTAAILGAGVQARTQLEAVCAVRPIQRAWVYAPTRAHAETFARQMSARLGIPVQAAESPAQALEQADVVCAATTARGPVFSDADVRPGTHINGVGSYTPQMVELPPQTLGRAAVFVDSRAAALAEAGEIIQAIQRGLLNPAAMTELGLLVNGEAEGRTSPEQITVFKSVGVGVQDALAAQVALAQSAETLPPQTP